MVCLSFITAWVVLRPSGDTKHSLFDVGPSCVRTFDRFRSRWDTSGCSQIMRISPSASASFPAMTGWRHAPQSDNINLFLSPYLQLSFIYLSSRCWSNSLIRRAVKLIYFLAAGCRQLAGEESQQSGSYNCGVIIFMQLHGFFLGGKRRFRLTCYGNKAAINVPTTSEYEGRAAQLSSNAPFSAHFSEPTQRELSSNTRRHASCFKNVNVMFKKSSSEVTKSFTDEVHRRKLLIYCVRTVQRDSSALEFDLNISDKSWANVQR